MKNITEEINKSANDHYRLMQQIRKFVLDRSSMLVVREAQGNIFRIATSDMAGISHVKI